MFKPWQWERFHENRPRDWGFGLRVWDLSRETLLRSEVGSGLGGHRRQHMSPRAEGLRPLIQGLNHQNEVLGYAILK